MGIGDWFGNKELQKYKARLTEHPEDAEAHFYLGTIYEKKNQVEAAIREFQEVLRINPKSAEAHFNLAVLYESQKEGKKAIVHVLQAGNLFGERNDLTNKDRARKQLKDYYEKYGFRPEDFESVRLETSGS